MGKVRAAIIGDEEAEQKQKEEAEKRRLAKIEAAKAEGRARKQQETTGEETVKSEENEGVTLVDRTEGRSPANDVQTGAGAPQKATASDNRNEDVFEGDERQDPGLKKKKPMVKKGPQKAAPRSAKYMASAKLIDKSKQYSVKDALALVEKAHMAKFDETVELHVNTLTTGVSGQVTLPHGTGKQTRIAILAPSKDAKAADDLLKKIEAGKIDFDVLVATPDAMPRLAKVARVLGPRGLMPNPKAGTVTPNPEAVAEKFAGGQMNFKTEAKAPIIHLSVGKLSFGAEKLTENIQAALKAIKSENIKKVVVKSTMSPAVRLQLGK